MNSVDSVDSIDSIDSVDTWQSLLYICNNGTMPIYSSYTNLNDCIDELLYIIICEHASRYNYFVNIFRYHLMELRRVKYRMSLIDACERLMYVGQDNDDRHLELTAKLFMYLLGTDDDKFECELFRLEEQFEYKE